jgi:hypothetical protein
MQDIDSPNNRTMLPECEHVFHSACIVSWFRYDHQECPMCRNVGVDVQQFASYQSRLHSAKTYMKSSSAPCGSKRRIQELEDAESSVGVWRKEVDRMRKLKTVKRFIEATDRMRAAEDTADGLSDVIVDMFPVTPIVVVHHVDQHGNEAEVSTTARAAVSDSSDSSSEVSSDSSSDDSLDS